MANFVRIRLNNGGQLIITPTDYAALKNRPHGQRCGEGCCPTVDVSVFGFAPADAREVELLLAGHAVYDESFDRVASFLGAIAPIGLKQATQQQIRAIQHIFSKPGWQPPHLRS